MEFTPRHPLAGLFAFFAPRSTVETSQPPQTISNATQLSQRIKRQKRLNDLVYVCQLDDQGCLKCRWVSESSL